MNDNLKENQIVDQAKKEMTSATRKPTPPTSVSIMVQVLRVVFSSIPTRLLTSQKPESLKWEQTVEPPAIAAVTQARYSGLSSLMPGKGNFGFYADDGAGTGGTFCIALPERTARSARRSAGLEQR